MGDKAILSRRGKALPYLILFAVLVIMVGSIAQQPSGQREASAATVSQTPKYAAAHALMTSHAPITHTSVPYASHS